LPFDIAVPRAAPRLLLIVTLAAADYGARARASLALQALGCGELHEGVYLAGLALRQASALSALVEQCSRDGVAVWLMAERAPHGDAHTYAPLVDRSDAHAQSLQAWRAVGGPLPPLAPGEMVRL
jgi:hypothetical protein